MAFTRGQTQVIYQFLPGAVFEHDQYGFCKISGVELQEKPVNQDAVFNAVADLLFQWPDDTFRGGFADPRQRHNRRLYAIGTPAPGPIRAVPDDTRMPTLPARLPAAGSHTPPERPSPPVSILSGDPRAASLCSGA